MNLDILQMLYVVRDGKVRWQSRRAKAMAAREVPRLVEQIKQARLERDEAKAVLGEVRAELGRHGRIARTLLTGALPATANVSREILLTRIDKVLDGRDGL